MLSEGFDASLFGQRGVNAAKLPPHVFEGLDSLQVGTLKYQMEGERMVAMCHYSELMAYLKSTRQGDKKLNQ